MRCKNDAKWVDVRGLLNEYWGPTYRVESHIASRVQTERNGICIWTLCLTRTDGLPIDAAEYEAMALRVQHEHLPGAKFITAGRYRGANHSIVVKYYPYDCECQDVGTTPTTRLENEPRYCTEIILHIENVLYIVKMLDQAQADTIIAQLLHNFVDLSARNKYLNISFVRNNEDKTWTNTVRVKIATAIAAIKLELAIES